MTTDIIDSVSIVSEEVIKAESSFFAKRKKNQRIDFQREGNIHILSKGTVSFYRVEDGMLSITINAPAVLGLFSLMLQEDMPYYIRCDEDCDMWTVSNVDFIAILNDKKLWQHSFDILSRYLSLYFRKEKMVSKKCVRDVVIEHLKFIWEMGESSRSKTSIYTFILSRNHISRSSVHKIIADLVGSGRITVARGRLIGFNF